MTPYSRPSTVVALAIVGAASFAVLLGAPPGPVAGLGGYLILVVGGFGTGFRVGYRTMGPRVRAYRPVALMAWIFATLGALLSFPLIRSRMDWLSFFQLCVVGGLVVAVASGVGGLFGWEFREGLKETNPV